MKNLADISPYNFMESEERWKASFEDLYSIKNLDFNKPKYYVLEMFPYPSGRIHMGHVRNYMFGDVIARYKRSCGFNVLHPIGWDSFGLPAENAALQRGVHPKDWTLQNIDFMKRQLQKLALSYSWDLETATCSEEYYTQQQQLFLELYNLGLVYKKKSLVNWDPVDQCVLANEQVIDGRGWRSGAVVEKKSLNQWFLKISDFSEELLTGLDTLSGWPEKVKTMQRNWIGKSQGAEIVFQLTNGESIKIFSTRADTIFGATFVAIAPDHALSKKLAKEDSVIENFITECGHGAVTNEFADKQEKKGVITKLVALHPITNERLPVYIANFILSDYGTGAIFGVPAHDERDYEFAKKLSLPIKQVIQSDTNNSDTIPYTDTEGVMINSGFVNGLSPKEARERVIQLLIEKGIGTKKTKYRLRDWGISRQRYWGCPIPMLNCPNCGEKPYTSEMLPAHLPTDVSFDKVGNPLERHPTWKYIKCPYCGANATRETDTMDTFVDSSWYYLKYCLKAGKTSDFNKQVLDYWMPVDQYVGGIEHAILHLLYARFLTKALSRKLDTSFSEPFKNLLTQGMVCHVTYKKNNGTWLYPEEVEKKGNQFYEIATGEEVFVGRSEKMSKSKKNVIDPDKIIEAYGTDAIRFFIISDTPPDRDFDWSTEGLDGSWRFINRIWRLFIYAADIDASDSTICSANKSNQLTSAFHIFLDNITNSLETNNFNKSAAFIRDFINTLYEYSSNISEVKSTFDVILPKLCIVLSIFMPYLAEELWAYLKQPGLACNQQWPQVDKQYLQKTEISLPIQVNGKLRGNISVRTDASEDEIFQKALEDSKIIKFIEGREIKKKIYVKNKIINIVI